MRIRGAIGLGIALVVLKLLLSDAFGAFERAATSFFTIVDTHITSTETSQQAFATPLFSIPHVYIDTTTDTTTSW